jgi:hypothetical protein
MLVDPEHLILKKLYFRKTARFPFFIFVHLIYLLLVAIIVAEHLAGVHPGYLDGLNPQSHLALHASDSLIAV